MRGTRSESKRLVIDTSVARASGRESAVDPTATSCRDFLQTVLNVCHQMVFSREIREEWKEHWSRFTRKWRVQMEARKKVVRCPDTEDKTFRDKIRASSCSDADCEAMLKDVFLIEAALATDSTVASLEKVARGLFATASKDVKELRNIVWVNPSLPEEESLQWLEDGAKPEEDRMLKRFSEEN